MNLKSVYKIPDGKLIKISLTYNKSSNTIQKVSIMGDFFAYPEEAIETIENELRNIKIEKKQMINQIKKVIKEKNFEFIGVTPEGLAQGIMMCLK